MPHYRRLDWSKSLLPQVARELIAEAAGPFVDLSDLLVIVPTAQAGRRLKEALALQLSGSNRGLLAPAVETPDSALRPQATEAPVATQAQVLAAWAVVLGEIRFRDFEAVFPVEPVRSTAWQLGMARRMVQLRAELGEAGLTFGTASEKITEAPYEPMRWEQLARLEERYEASIEKLGLLDPVRCRRRNAEQWTLPDGIRRVILAATPDPQAIALTALEQIDRQQALEIWIYGPAEAATGGEPLFDTWGRPAIDPWCARHLTLENWGCKTQSVAGAREIAAHLSERMRGRQPESVALGILDSNLIPPLQRALEADGIECFDPGGDPVHLGGSGRLADLLCGFSADASFRTVRRLLENTDLWAWLRPSLPEAVGHAGLLQQLDDCFVKHLCRDLSDVHYFASRETRWRCLAAVAQKLAELREELVKETAIAGQLAASLARIYSGRTLRTSDEGDRLWRDAARSVRESIEDVREAARLFPGLSSEFQWNAQQLLLREARTTRDRPGGAHDLLGWLELLWNDAPELILAGMNEGLVPDAVVGDPFLPEALRTHLGLRTNEARLARDAYLLEALCHRRCESGGIDILIPRTAPDGTPLRPSRLLFMTENTRLPERVSRVFGEADSPRPAVPHHPAWHLGTIARAQPPDHLSASAFKAYLQCPLRFFLTRILAWEVPPTGDREMSAADFGLLFHRTVEALEGTVIGEDFSADALAQQLIARARHLREERYGTRLSFALRLQEVALHARLEAFAKAQVADVRANGPVEILETEASFTVEIDGMPIRGKIDRVDRRADGRLELIDYKTADTALTPTRAHLAGERAAAPQHLPPEASFELEGKRYRWKDLQLPIYAMARTAEGAPLPGVAYFNLPKTAEHAGLSRWGAFSETYLEAARCCVAALTAQILEGRFWPPNPAAATPYDPIAPLFPEGIENTLRAKDFERYAYGPRRPETNANASARTGAQTDV